MIPPLSAQDTPPQVKELRDELGGMLPSVPITSLPIELDARTGFLECTTHPGSKSTQSAELKRNILAVPTAGATNLGDGCHQDRVRIVQT